MGLRQTRELRQTRGRRQTRGLRQTHGAALNGEILGHEIGSIPINNLSLGFLLRMDVELVEDHHLLVTQIVERPILGLAVGRDIGTERRIACLGELNPHLVRK